jgi:hypothetical protein
MAYNIELLRFLTCVRNDISSYYDKVSEGEEKLINPSTIIRRAHLAYCCS